jgi:hypothetical protein
LVADIIGHSTNARGHRCIGWWYHRCICGVRSGCIGGGERPLVKRQYYRIR